MLSEEEFKPDSRLEDVRANAILARVLPLLGGRIYVKS